MPRSTGDVRLGLDVTVNTLPCPRMPRRFGSGISTRRNRSPYTPGPLLRPTKISPGPGLQREERDPLAVDGHLELVGVGEPHAAVTLALNPAQQVDRDLILAVPREVMLDQQPTPRPERQAVNMVRLWLGLSHPVLVYGRGRESASQRGATDLARRLEILLELRLADTQDPGDVVEAVARVVGRQQ